MSHHTLTLLALGDDLALLAVASWWTAAELRWRRSCTRRRRLAATTSRQEAPEPHEPDRPDRNPMDHRKPRQASPHETRRPIPAHGPLADLPPQH